MASLIVPVTLSTTSSTIQHGSYLLQVGNVFLVAPLQVFQSWGSGHSSYWKWKVKVLVTPSCLTLCNCSPPDSSVHAILQAEMLEWEVIFFPRGSSWPRDQTQVSCISGQFFTIWDTTEAQKGDRSPWLIVLAHSSLTDNPGTGLFLKLWYVCSVAQSYPILYKPLDCIPAGSLFMVFFRHESWSGLPFPLQQIFPTQRLNQCLLCLLHCSQILYPLSHWEKAHLCWLIIHCLINGLPQPPIPR